MESNRFREAERDEAACLVSVINAAYAPAEEFLYEGPRISLDEVRKKQAVGTFLVETSGADVRGCVHVEVRGEAGFFCLLAVPPEHQGRGIARALVKAAEDYARSRGCSVMELDVINHRLELFGFYRAAGYSIVGKRNIERDVAWRLPSHLVVMQKSLA